MKSLCVVIVTYADRFEFLDRVIKRIHKENDIKKFFIIDNASVEPSKNLLKNLKISYPDKVQLYRFEENKGSAGGFKKGIELALKCQECDYILLLDDDNLPEENFLEKIRSSINNISFDKDKDAFWIFRTDRENFLDYVSKNQPDGMLPDKNGFLGFHIFTISRKLFKLILNRIFPKSKLVPSSKISVIKAAPYGGLLFHKNLIQRIGLPREEFFVYVDDYEWTYRISKKGGNIFSIFSAKIEDIDKSWHKKKDKKSFFSKIFEAEDSFRIYYLVRNRTVFELENFVENKLLYKINRYLFFRILKIYGRNKPERYKLIINAIKDGEEGKLGKVDFYEK